jgi:hypothetical protein
VAVREALIAIAAALALLQAVARPEVERYAVVVGNDVGQPPDLALRWAEADASRVAAVLEEVGGVRPENLVLLRGKDADVVRRALIAVNDRIRDARRESVLFVYYSGHADAEALTSAPRRSPSASSSSSSAAPRRRSASSCSTRAARARSRA